MKFVSTAERWRPSGNGRLVRLLGAVLVGCIAMTACSSTPRQGDTSVIESTDGPAGLPPAEKNGTGELRTDLEPLLSRFDALASPLAAAWMSGTTGDDRAPGPATYWIDAIVTLDPSTAAALRTDFGAVQTDVMPDVVEGLTEILPSGPWLASPELDEHTNGGGLGGRAFIAVDSDDLVIIKVGGPN